MTTVEKAIAYNEAIEKGKQILNTPYTAHWDIMKEVAEHLLPELRESNDEKIRKELIDFLEYYRLNNVLDSNTISLLTDSVAWLEKQGEQKAVIVPKFRIGDTVRAKTMKDFVFTIKDVTDKQYVDTNDGKYDIEGQDYLELVEQKPAWSEEDERAISVLKNIIKKSEIIDSIIYTDSVKEKLYAWLKSLRPQKQWKPTEEQIATIKYIIRKYESTTIHLYDGAAKQLYLLLEQLKQL